MAVSVKTTSPSKKGAFILGEDKAKLIKLGCCISGRKIDSTKSEDEVWGGFGVG
jgi:hypothetical protein